MINLLHGREVKNMERRLVIEKIIEVLNAHVDRDIL